MNRRFIATALGTLLLTGCGESYRPIKRERPAVPNSTHARPALEGPDLTDVSGGQLDLGTIRLSAPDDWVRKSPRSGFVLAEFSLPRTDPDNEDGRLTVSVAGGSIEANVERWRNQFGEESNGNSQQEIEIAGIRVTLVDFSGTFKDQPGPLAPAVERQGYRMLGAIIPVGGQLHFVKGYGPEKTMAKHADEFHAFLQTLKVNESSR